jgi:dephospho-CoA kinase
LSKYIVGLTGGIGSGKTTVADEFARLGITLVDADVIARDVVKPGSNCLNAIVKQFGEQMLLPDQTLDRAQLRTAIFSDADKKRWLNALMHPAIREQMLKELSEAESDYCFLVAPLLFENQLEQYVHSSVVVDVPEQVQVSRTTSRDDVSTEQVKNIIKAQISRADRLAKADVVINNNLPWAEVKPQIEQLHAKYMALSKKKT